jgi:hypothetical protein
MNMTATALEVAGTIVATAVPFALGVRALAGRSEAIERLDASAATLYPAVREEADPPRWRLDLLGSAATPDVGSQR